MGRKPVAAECLSSLVALSGVEVVAVITDDHLEVSPTREVARANDITLLTFEEAIEACELEELQFDLGISMLFWRKLPRTLLEVSTLGVVNFHPAPLPQYKGVGGYNLAILDGCTEWACTAHYVDESIDTGEIISLEWFPIDPEAETAKTLEAKSQIALAKLFQRIFSAIFNSRSYLPSRPNQGGKYLSRAELESMKRIEVGVDDIERKVRAFWFPPYDGAYLELGGDRFTLVSCNILESLADPSSSSLFTGEYKPDERD